MNKVLVPRCQGDSEIEVGWIKALNVFQQGGDTVVHAHCRPGDNIRSAVYDTGFDRTSALALNTPNQSPGRDFVKPGPSIRTYFTPMGELMVPHLSAFADCIKLEFSAASSGK